MVEVAEVRVERELAAALHAVGAMLGLPITTSERDEWTLDDTGLRVGFGWYAARGHGTKEAIALAALHLWEGPLEAIRSPERDRRASGLERAQPDIVPLVRAIRRTQAGFELLRAMPGLRAPLQAAVVRSLPTDLSTQQRHLQWVSLVLGQLAPAHLQAVAEDPQVLHEWQLIRALGGEDVNPLLHVLMPDPSRTPLRRLERALALLLPAYQRLSLLDIADAPTVLGGSDRAELSLEAEAPLNSDDLSASEADQSDDSASDSDSDPDTPSLRDADQLTPSAHEEFVQTVLGTPIPDASSVAAAGSELDAHEVREQTALTDTSVTAAAGAASATILADYRARSAEFAGEIDRIRALFARIVSERVALKRSQSRRAFPDGDELATDRFASIISESRAGVRAPNAFRRRTLAPRLTSESGSADYVLLVDASASMTGPSSAAAADAMLILLEGLAAVERDIAHAEQHTAFSLELDIRTSLIVFDAEATVLKPLSRGLDDEVRRRMHAEARTPSGSTNDAAALAAAAAQFGLSRAGDQNLDGRSRKRIVILVSDGGTNDTAAADRELRRLRASGIDIYGVGLGTDDLAQRYSPDGVALFDPRELPRLLERIIAEHLSEVG